MSTAVITSAEEELDDPKIEDSVSVYLRWRDSEKAWEVEDNVFDGMRLDSPYGMSTDIGNDPDELPEDWRKEWDNATQGALPTGVELFAMLGLAAACNDGEVQGKLHDLHVAQAEMAKAMEAVDQAAEGMSNDDELEAQSEAIEATEGALDAALALLRMAGLLSPEA